MKKIFLSAILISAICYFSSCSSVTDISGTWVKPATPARKYSKIVVIGMMDDIVKKSTIENSIVKDLRSKGINAVAGSNIMPENLYDADKNGLIDDKDKDKALIASDLKDQGVDGAFIFSLTDTKEQEHYVPGTTYYQPYTGYYPFYNYFYTSYERVHTPGYITKSTNVFYASNFYNVSTGDLIWSAQSETINPLSLNDFAKSYSSAVVDDFLNSGLIIK